MCCFLVCEQQENKNNIKYMLFAIGMELGHSLKLKGTNVWPCFNSLKHGVSVQIVTTVSCNVEALSFSKTQ